MSMENLGLGGFVSGLQQKAGEIAEGLKDQAEKVVGEENVKKVTDVLGTDDEGCVEAPDRQRLYWQSH